MIDKYALSFSKWKDNDEKDEDEKESHMEETHSDSRQEDLGIVMEEVWIPVLVCQACHRLINKPHEADS